MIRGKPDHTTIELLWETHFVIAIVASEIKNLHLIIIQLARYSNHLDMFSKKDVLKIIASFTGKQLCRSLFLLKLRAILVNFLNFSAVNFGKFLRTGFLKNTSGGFL